MQDRDGAPIGGVRVTVLDHPELGETNTRADGAFDIAVNGGGVTLSFVVAGFLPVQRTLAPGWQDYETLDDVVMVPVDPNVKTIDPDRPRRSRSCAAPSRRTRTASARARCCSRRASTARWSSRAAARGRSTS